MPASACASPAAYLLGKMVMAMGVAAVVSTLLLALALGVAHVALDAAQVLQLFATSVLGVLPFCALGLLIGTLVKGQGAPGVVNLIYLPMAFLSGLWLPLNILPAFFAKLAPVFPAYHLGQVALKVVDADAGGNLALHLAALAAVTIAFFLLARARLARMD